MSLAAVIALAMTALNTVSQMVANGQATTNAEQDAALAAANNAADSANQAANDDPAGSE